MLEYSLTVPTWQKGCIEEMVILDETRDIIKYTFSNSLDNIRTAIYARTRHNIKLERAAWKLNPDLSISVKHLMNYYNVNFSMTTDIIEKINFIVVNMRVGDNWFITGYEKINGKFISWDFLHTCSMAEKMAKDLIKRNNSYNDDTDD
jgi:hypothetical protein